METCYRPLGVACVSTKGPTLSWHSGLLFFSLLNGLPWLLPNRRSHGNPDTVFLSPGLLCDHAAWGNSSKWGVTDRINFMETWRNEKRKQSPADTIQMCCGLLFILPLLRFAKQFKFNRFIIYHKMMLCEPMNFFSKREEVRQLFKFHKVNQMWLWFHTNGIQTVGGNWGLCLPCCCCC